MNAKTLDIPFKKLLRSVDSKPAHPPKPKSQRAKTNSGHRRIPEHSQPKCHPSLGDRALRPPNWADLPILAVVVLLVNLPYLAGRMFPLHDTKTAFALFDYFYSGYFYDGVVPHWMAYGLYGLDATIFRIWQLTGSSLLTMVAGRALGVRDSLLLFEAGLLVEQCLFLWGMWALCGRLFQERTTRFCVCLTAVCTVAFQVQLDLNWRWYYLLPVIFYLMLRWKEDGAGWCGWAAACLLVVGPMGGDPYCYPLWEFVAVVFGVALFASKPKALLALIKPSWKNAAGFAGFLILAGLLICTLYGLRDEVVFVGPDRQQDAGISLHTFLTWGKRDLGTELAALFVPFANVALYPEQRPLMADYVGAATIVGLLGLPTVRKLYWGKAAPFLATAAVLFLFSRGGWAAEAAYYCVPGMKLFRHVSYVTGVLKVLLALLAGFGLDSALRRLPSAKIIPAVLALTIADCVWVQAGTLHRLQVEPHRVKFLVEPLPFVGQRSTSIAPCSTNGLERAKTWQGLRKGQECQVDFCSVMHADLPIFAFRMDMMMKDTHAGLAEVWPEVTGAPKLEVVGQSGTASERAFTPDSLLADVSAQGTARLVYRDASARGWTAEVNGKPSPVLKADGGFKAVDLPPGMNRVQLRYGGPRCRCLDALSWIAAAISLALLAALGKEMVCR
jgi:hypothetical protein